MAGLSVFSLLLLVCCLSAAQDSDITEQSTVSDQRQTCPADVHSVLRDMSAALAELRVRMEYLQKHNTEQAEKLRELQKQTSQVEPIKQQLQAHSAELHSIKTQSNVTENQVETLRRDKAVGQVAFSASLLATDSETFGPFPTHTPLVFKYIVSNIGNAYNPNSGIFTAPVRGAYHFGYNIGAHGNPSSGSATVLVKNGQHIFATYEHQTNGFGTASNGATLLLEAGDAVFMRLWQDSRIFDNENHHSTFSGHLLFPM